MYHIRVLIPCYKEELHIVQKTLNAIREAALPAGELKSCLVAPGCACLIVSMLCASRHELLAPCTDLSKQVSIIQDVCCLQAFVACLCRLRPHGLPAG